MRADKTNRQTYTRTADCNTSYPHRGKAMIGIDTVDGWLTGCWTCDSVLSWSGRARSRGSGSKQRSRDPVIRRLYRGDSADVSRLLDSLLYGYDKRLRPNYSGTLSSHGCRQQVAWLLWNHDASRLSKTPKISPMSPTFYSTFAKRKKTKSMYLYSVIYIICIPQSAQAWITQFYLQITLCLTFLRKRSPDGATPTWGSRHSIAAYYSSIDPSGIFRNANRPWQLPLKVKNKIKWNPTISDYFAWSRHLLLWKPFRVNE